MMRKIKNKIEVIVFCLVILVLTSSFVSAFGVASPYWKDNPLVMAKGEKRIVNLNLQNMVGEVDVRVKAEIKKGEDIATLRKEVYAVKAGTSDTLVPVVIKIPKNATGTRKIEIAFKTITSGEGEGVVMGTGMNIGFDVLISEKVVEKPFLSMKSLLIALIIVIICIGIILLIKKNKRH